MQTENLNQAETFKKPKLKYDTWESKHIQTSQEKQSGAGFLWKPVEHLEATDEDNLKPRFTGGGGG